MTSKHVACAIVVLGALSVAPAIARAETIAVVVAGDPGKKSTVVDAISPWLEARGQTTVLDAMPADEQDKLVDCYLADDAACAKKLVAGQDVDRLVFVMVQTARGDAESYELSGTLYKGDGTVLATQRRDCGAGCRVDVLTRASEDLAARLWRAADPSGATIKITSTPPGATVTVDGLAVGKTPLEHVVTPGTHQISIELPDHEVQTRSVAAGAGTIEEVDTTLKPIRGAKAKSRVPWILIGTGAGGILTSVVLFALDEDNPEPGPMRPMTYRDTILPAVGFGIAGAAALGTGLYLLRKQNAEHAPIATVSGGTVVVGWTGRF